MKANVLLAWSLVGLAPLSQGRAQAVLTPWTVAAPIPTQGLPDRAPVGDGLLEPLVLLLGQRDTNGLAFDFARPGIAGAPGARSPILHIAFTEPADVGQLLAEAGVFGLADDDTKHLQYLATEASKVRDAHLALNGLILPKNDPFWDKHYPAWEWGCWCRVRPINPDLLEEERELDRERKPEDRLVMKGPALERLRQGQVVRGELRDRDGRTVGMGAHDVTPPSEKPGGDKAYQWSPEDLRLNLDELKARHDPAVWDECKQWAGSVEIEPETSVMDWVSGSTPVGPQAGVSVSHENQRSKTGNPSARAVADTRAAFESAAADARGGGSPTPAHDEDRSARPERIVPLPDGKLSVVTSQPRIAGTPTSPREIDALMATLGFERLGEGGYLDRSRGILVCNNPLESRLRAACLPAAGECSAGDPASGFRIS